MPKKVKSSIPDIYCVKCKKKTGNKGEVATITTKNGRKMLQTKCAICGTKKCQFVKG